MNYSQSPEILSEIQKAKRILLNCHRRPDADSVGSALAMYETLTNLGKEVRVLCVDKIPHDLRFLPNTEVVEQTDFKKFEYKEDDLFITLDSGEWRMVSGSMDIQKPTIKLAVIDHHQTNKGYGTFNLIDPKISSTAELLYLIFQDWKIEINKDIAQCLLAGIIGDTGTFEYPDTTSQTLKIAGDLIEKGADKNEIIFNIFRSVKFNELKMWGEFLNRMQIDKEHKFVWSAIPLDIYEKYSEIDAKSTAASLFGQIVDGTEFGIIMLEDRKDHLSLSMRSRANFDVSKIAQELNGGGHRGAAGGSVDNLPFEKAVEKVLEAARKYSN